MSAFDNMMLKVDETITNVLGEWDIYSTTITAGIVTFLVYQLFSRRDPDTHPMLLERQAQASPVRNIGESAVFRSQSSPHGMDLNTGLNVRDPGLSKWARGRNGDLRDVWRRVVNGPTDEDGKSKGERGRILTVLGSEQVVDHNLDEISREINIIGQQIKHHGGKRVAIYLPNSIEFLTALFACTFYGLTPILLSYDQHQDDITAMLKNSEADTLIAAVGSLSFEAVVRRKGLRQLIWVVDEGSKHMDWNEVPKGTGGAINVSTWQEIIEDHRSSTSELPAINPKDSPQNLAAFWRTRSEAGGQPVEYSQSNLVSAISAQISAIPANQRIGPADLFLPADSLSNIYTLTVTLAAVYCNASLVLNSVAGHSVGLSAATQAIAPTVIVASPNTLSKAHEEACGRMASPITKAVHWSQTRTLTQDGVLPAVTMLTRFNDSLRPAIGTTPGKLRLLFVAEQAGGDSASLSSLDLSDLRIFTGARVIYALTAAPVAGAISQTSFYDYRVDKKAAPEQSHFGPPLSSVEVLLRDTLDFKTTDELTVGEIIVRGPAVVGGEAALGLVGRIRDDHTLAYA